MYNSWKIKPKLDLICLPFALDASQGFFVWYKGLGHVKVVRQKSFDLSITHTHTPAYQSDPVADGVPQGMDVGHGLLEAVIFQKWSLVVFDVWSPQLWHRWRHRGLERRGRRWWRDEAKICDMSERLFPDYFKLQNEVIIKQETKSGLRVFCDRLSCSVEIVYQTEQQEVEPTFSTINSARMQWIKDKVKKWIIPKKYKNQMIKSAYL